MWTRQSSFAAHRFCRAGIMTVSMLALWLCGCLPPPHMELSDGIVRAGKAGRWWFVPSPTSRRGPIVGVEQRVSDGRIRQWLVDDRGVRLFDYRDRRALKWGPPLATHALGDDFSVVPSLVRARFGAESEPGWPGPPLPGQEVDRLHASSDLVALLKRYWADNQTDPPSKLTPHEIEQAMEAARITVFDLLALDM